MSTSVKDFDPASIKPRGGYYINGEWLPGPGAIAVRRPSDNQVYGEIPDAGPEIVDRAATAAQKALDASDWSRRAPRERARLALTAQIKPGHTWHADANFSPIISTIQAERIRMVVGRAVANGARELVGERFGQPGEGCFCAPTILDGVTAESEAVREEIFGPVLTVQRFDDEEEGIAPANDSVYGLAAGVHTGSLNRAMRAVRAIEAGTIWINRYGRTSDFILPTGGYKQSGIGKDLGRQAYESNQKYKTVLMDFGQG